jgi:integrase
MSRSGKLTAMKVAALVRAAKPGYVGDGGGLYLEISKYGSASWCARYRVDGRLREMGLGSYDTWSLSEARDRARKVRQMRSEGIDPIEQRRADRQHAKLDAARAITFKACGEAYIAAHKAGWRNAKHAAQWPATLHTYAYPVFGDLAVQAVDVALVMKALEPIWTEKPQTASRVRGRIENVIDWATARGYRHGENPARWRGHLENLLPNKNKVRRVEHHRALPYQEVGAFMAELRALGGTPARALEFAVLTGARTGEVVGARWGEMNLAERLWTIPGERMKAGLEHRVPLSDAALSIIKAMAEIRQGDLIFPGGKANNQPLSNTAFFHLLRKIGRGDLTAHGFRSTLRDWAAEQTNFPREVAELALAHAVGSAVERSYQRSDLFDRRRRLMAAWARHCSTPMAGQVVPIRRVAEAST